MSYLISCDIARYDISRCRVHIPSLGANMSRYRIPSKNFSIPNTNTYCQVLVFMLTSKLSVVLIIFPGEMRRILTPYVSRICLQITGCGGVAEILAGELYHRRWCACPNYRVWRCSGDIGWGVVPPQMVCMSAIATALAATTASRADRGVQQIIYVAPPLPL